MNIPKNIIIPSSLEECFTALENMLYPEEINELMDFSEDDLAVYHHGVGRWMRNNWGLWKGSVLCNYFKSMGINHPDDMSGIIITSFHRYLHNKPLKLDEQIKYYQDYWAKSKFNQPVIVDDITIITS